MVNRFKNSTHDKRSMENLLDDRPPERRTILRLPKNLSLAHEQESADGNVEKLPSESSEKKSPSHLGQGTQPVRTRGYDEGGASQSLRAQRQRTLGSWRGCRHR